MQTYRDISYNLSRSQRKTASIYIERDGQVSVKVPAGISQEKINDILEKKRVWIYKGLAQWRVLNASKVHREFVNGEGFMYLGRSYRLKLVEKQKEALILKEGHFLLRVNGLSPQVTFKEFYREKGLPKLKARVRYFEGKMGIKVNDVRVMELKNRWASCSAGKRINFHWKCLMAPLPVIDYIIVHEMAHILHRNHTAAFWNEIDKVLPKYREQVEWLRRNGAGFSL